MFDVSNLTFRDQFEAAVAVSGVCLAAAVLLREWFTDRDIRVIARVLGIAGYAVVVTFAWRMTETNETLATQLMVKSKKASEIAEVRQVALITKNGTRIEIGEGHGVRTVSGAYGNRSLGNRTIANGSTANRSADSGPDGHALRVLHAIHDVYEWAGAAAFTHEGSVDERSKQF